MSHRRSRAICPLPRAAAVGTCAGLLTAITLPDRPLIDMTPVVDHLQAELRIRFGLRWRVGVPVGHIPSIRPATGAERAYRKSVDLRLALPAAAWTRMELDRPATAVGMYGLRRQVRTPGLGVDEPERLIAALDAYRAARPTRPAEHTHDERT